MQKWVSWKSKCLLQLPRTRRVYMYLTITFISRSERYTFWYIRLGIEAWRYAQLVQIFAISKKKMKKKRTNMKEQIGNNYFTTNALAQLFKQIVRYKIKGTLLF